MNIKIRAAGVLRARVCVFVFVCAHARARLASTPRLFALNMGGAAARSKQGRRSARVPTNSNALGTLFENAPRSQRQGRARRLRRWRRGQARRRRAAWWIGGEDY